MPAERVNTNFNPGKDESNPSALIKKDFKRRGEIEVSCDLEPLPLTTVSPSAQGRFESWGYTPEQVKHLQEHTSSFRYDLVPNKLRRLIEDPVEVFKENEQEYANLPSFLDTGSRFDGQCLDITKQWFFKSHESGLIEELNKNIKGKNRVIPMGYTGTSETHFCRKDSRHHWNGVALVNEDGDIIDEIFVDASFQTIKTRGESNNVVHETYVNPEKFDNNKGFRVGVGSISVYEDDFTGSKLDPAYMGISFDRAYVYGFGFARETKTLVRPVLIRTYSDGGSDSYIINDGRILAKGNKERADQDRKEVEEILEISKRFNIVEVDKPTKEETVIWQRPQ